MSLLKYSHQIAETIAAVSICIFFVSPSGIKKNLNQNKTSKTQKMW